ncbi:poly(R)-hydroxyalkanoic acid synthase subunit PhaE [Serpentinicella sp. ANB-PHB4]|uniref:poly(R)-hydroxyalkanoic acid synthase subunit PhaE n=1 Tax=Serpentinicella sp. ANB-PHB4 TaxID=3074076 RepID=UPI002856E41C|nr:poly(R)-hydroxyalkanoic acid synthase subunit PhaE [Serpentinicella sp. ANB-PHB4]MDR5658647.1 poly(R)-hydroxyalkanoic acid synthase subunit PhaE [Serpentinicella sp. ANB-PHB4]
MGMMNGQENYVGKWFDVQKKMFDVWKENATPKFAKDFSGYFEGNKLVTDGMKSSIDMYNKWYEAVSDMYKGNNTMLGDNTYFDFYNNMMSGANVYSNLKRFWDDMRDKFVGNESNDAQTFISYIKVDEYMKELSDKFVPYLPEPAQKLFQEAMQMQEMFMNRTEKFFEPWTKNANQLQELLGKSMLGDQDAFRQYAKIWNDNYKTSFGQLVDMTKLDMGKDFYNKQMESMNAFVKYYNNLNEFGGTIVKVGYESMDKIVKNYQEMLKEGTQPKTFQEFYTYWWTENQDSYKKLFNNEDFTNLMEQVVEAGNTFKKNYQKLVEEQLEQLPFSTKKDMESLSKALNDLRKEVKNLGKDMNNDKKPAKAANS